MNMKMNPYRGKEYKTKNMNLQLFAGEIITDLTGYTWVGNNTITWAFMQPSYSLSFTSNNMNFDTIGNFVSPEDENYLYYGFQMIYTYDFITNQWSNDTYKTIQITGGIDATDATLIQWLQDNGRLTAPQPAGYSSTINLTNCACNKSDETGLTGSYSATITANEGYYLSSVTSTLGIVEIATNKKTATIEISDVTVDFTISAIASPLVSKNVLLHPSNRGTPQPDVDLLPKGITDNNKQDIIQVSTMPTPVPGRFEQILQYVGETDQNYTKGYFYKCVISSNNYVWSQVAVQTGDIVSGKNDVIDREDTLPEATVISADIIEVNKEDVYIKKKTSGSGYEYEKVIPYDLPTLSQRDVNRLFETEYTITANISNGSIVTIHPDDGDTIGPDTMWEDESAVYIQIMPDEGYTFPEGVTVTGATYQYSGGAIELTRPTENIVITGACVIVL